MRGLKPKIVGKVYPKASPVVSLTISPQPALLMSRLGTRTAVKPPSLAANVVSASSINLVATPATGFVVSRYQFQFSSDGGVNYVPIAAQASATYLLTGLAEYTTYHFRVVMEDAQGNSSSASTAVSGRTLALAPTAPALTATAVSSSQINLAATGAQSAAGIASYTFQVATAAGGPWSALVTQSSPNYSHTGLPGSATRYYRVFVTDVQSSPLSSGNSSVVSATTSASAATVSWNPGHYAFPDHHMYPSKYTAIESDINSLVTPTDKRAKIVGVRLLASWGMFEPTQGNYDFSKLAYFIAYAKARGLRVGLAFAIRRYGGAIPSVPQADYRDTTLPDYVISNGWAGANTDDLGGYSARLDIAACASAFFAMISALGAYVRNEPYFEFFETPETSAAFAPGQGFSQSNWNAQWLNFVPVLRTAFPNKLVFVDCNYHSSVTETNTLVDLCITQGVGIGGPDTMPQNLGTTDDHWGFMHLGGVGTRIDPIYGPYNFGTVDSRGSIPAKAGQEVIQSTTFTPASIYGHAYNIYRASHMVWTMHGNPAQTRYGENVPAMIWESGVWPYLRDNSVPMRSAFPTRLTELGISPITGGT